MAITNITASFKGADDLNAVAGLKAVYMANFDADLDISKGADDIDGMLITGLPATGFEVYKFPLKGNGSNYNEVSAGDRQTGTTAFTGTTNLVFTKIDPVKSFQIRSMVWGRPIIFLETNGGDVLAVGIERGVEFVVTTDLAGEMAGNNQYQLVGTSEESNPAYFLDDATVTALKAAVVA